MGTNHKQGASENLQKKPNIIYILADDMGYGDLSCLNLNSKIQTVHLDRMANEGISFTDAHSSSAVCTPSRYSILTGRYNWRSSLKRGVLDGYSTHLIEEGRLTVASILQESGYKTSCIGKWHLGMDWSKNGDGPGDIDFSQPIKRGPNDYGFDTFFGISASLDMPPYVYIENDRVTQIPDRITKNDGSKTFWREGPTAANFKHEEVMPLLTQLTLDTIEAHQDEPFFIYFPLPAPHTPILPTEEFLGKSGTNDYGDFVLMCDDVIGQILNKLDELNIANNTIVIYTSDNGCSPRADYEELAAVGHNPSYHFRGHKADIYEGGHRVPLLIRWPDRIQPNRLSDETVCLVDLMATVAELLSFSLPEHAGEDSVSNLSIWFMEEHDKPVREAMVHHSIDGSFSIRKGRWKLELCPGSGGWSSPRPGQEPEGAPAFQLYDLNVDVGETDNVVNDRPEIVAELKSLLTRYIEKGRSTPGAKQSNSEAEVWPGLHWL
ncbi:sulfatase-like hydrolase/transferase [Paenibacillus sp. LMG 31456]|uniref:Sulfatase-like hydrolase/transferase n=1 Tax=Paenibacillus foliorum TaxID=2654974 RepID=A0A972GW86_9BACL|nr:arylsulfatase [Paenibacillus foliorum]NOU97280.1 sulfatase-like hydrolase/transferase [Paenibacillus foliorum]